MYRIARFMLIASSFCLSPLALADTAPQAAHNANTSNTATVPAPDSPQAIQDLHAMLIKAYLAGKASDQQGGMPQVTGLPTPQGEIPPGEVVPAPVPHAHRPILAAWVEVLRNAIDTLSSAAFIAAWGFAIGMVMMGIAALLLAVNLRRRPRQP